MRILVLSFIITFTGCASISEVGHVVNNKAGFVVYREQTTYCTPGIVSPSMCVSTLADTQNYDRKEGRTTETFYIFNAATTGWLESLTGGAAAVGSAYLVGKGLSESGSGDSELTIGVQAGSTSGVSNSGNMPGP